MTGNLRTLTALELKRAFENRELSPVEVAASLLDHVQHHDHGLNAWCLIERERTLARAQASERRYRDGSPLGLLDGIPVAIQDLFLTPMWPTTRGSHTTAPATTREQSSPAVAALERHGYVPLGKTTTSEFGWKAVTDSPLQGTTTNPWDPNKTAGGSSGGSAAALAACMTPLALGTDPGGSIRIPAAFCGVVGFKPTFGAVPHWPASPFASLMQAGPMARTVADAALLLQAISDADSRDCQAAPRRGLDYLATLEQRGLAGLRIAYSNNLGYVDVPDDIERATAEAVQRFREFGATVVDVDPGFSNPQAAFGHLFYGGLANACRDLGPRQRERLDPALLEVVQKAEKLSMLDYLAADNKRRELSERMARFHERYDLLVTPTLPLTAFDSNREVPPDWPSTRWTTWTPFTYPFNMTGQPALSVPIGLADDGLPLGMQIIGRRFEDDLVLRAGHLFEQLCPFRQHPELAGAGLEAA